MPRPRTGETPIRHVRVPAKVWDQIVRIAEAEGRTITAVVIDALTRYLVWHKRQARKDAASE